MRSRAARDTSSRGGMSASVAALAAACGMVRRRPLAEMQAEGWVSVYDFAEACDLGRCSARDRLERLVAVGRGERSEARTPAGKTVSVYRLK